MSEKKAADKAKERIDGFKTKLVLRYGMTAYRRMQMIALAVGAVLLLIIAAVLFLKINTIEVVTGDVTIFNESEVIAAAGIDIGDGLYHKSSWAIKKDIQRNMPLAQKVSVSKTPFGKVKIKVELLSVDYYTKIGDKYYALDKELRVLDSNASGSKYSAYGGVLVKLPETREPVLGEPLVFFDTVEETDTEGETVYEIREESFYSYVTKFLSELKDSGYHDDANGVILEEKFDVTVIYAEKFKIKFGNVSDLDVKFRVLYEILAEGSMQYSDKATIDLSDPTRPTARTDLTLDFSEYLD